MLQTPQPTPPHHVAGLTPPMSKSGSPSAALPALADTPNTKVPMRRHILIVTGPAGCGKSTVAKNFAARYGFKYIEGDDFHPPANIAKMEANIPLDDADRWDWLILLRDEALRSLQQGANGVVVTCSALKKKYRDVIRTAKLYDEDPNAAVHFIYLRASLEELMKRVAARQNHYMKESMVASQLAALQEPDEDEVHRLKDVRIIDVKGTEVEMQQVANAVVDAIFAEDAEKMA